MLQSELISIIIPVYNVGEYVTKCIVSVLNQTYRNIEIILINDGSIDDSSKICEKYASLDNRIRLINKSNGGLSSARNAGLNVARGKYISFVDSDDYISPVMLEVLLSNLKSHNADISECGVHFTSEISKVSDTIVINMIDKETWLLNVIKKNQYSVWRRLYKKELLENKEFKIGYIYEDVFFLYDILSGINRIVQSNQKLYFYFDEGHSIMRSAFSEKNIDVIVASKYQYDFVINSHFNQHIKVLVSEIYASDLINTFCNLSYYPHYDMNKSFRNLIQREINLLPKRGKLSLLISKAPVLFSSAIINLKRSFKLKIVEQFRYDKPAGSGNA